MSLDDPFFPSQQFGISLALLKVRNDFPQKIHRTYVHKLGNISDRGGRVKTFWTAVPAPPRLLGARVVYELKQGVAQ